VTSVVDFLSQKLPNGDPAEGGWPERVGQRGVSGAMRAGATRKRIALLIESSRVYGRGVLRGIAIYARTDANWSIYQEERALGDPPPKWLRNWPGDGIIARADTKQLASEIRRLKLPTVDLSGLFPLPGVPVIDTDDRGVVRMACEHLLERGFRSFAFCGFAGAGYSERRKTLAIEYLGQAGITVSICETPHKRLASTSRIESRGVLHEQQLGDWLVGLHTPTALLACNDIRAQQVLSVCRERGVHVPDEVAVMGVDNDEVVCELADPPLSSVENDTVRIGHEAAALLTRMIDGNAPPQPRQVIEPLGVVIRRSTDVLAVDDKAVAAALRFIHDHACDGIGVPDIVKHLPVSRSTLERRFLRAVGKSPKAEINRVRIERIKQLLVDTEYKLAVVARMTGFMHAEYMSALFKESTGLTPGKYRKIHQLSDNGRL
jgi:LacI family transcriptional regulator